MMLTLDNGKEKLGIMVDEVLGVEELSSSFSTGNIGSVHDSRFIGGIAGRKGDDAMILIIDHSQVYLFNEDTA